MRLTDNLKLLFKEKETTVSNVSRITEIPIQTIHNWMNGHQPQNIEYLKKLSEYFGLTIDEICFSSSSEVLKSKSNTIDKYEDEINAGVFEVILRRVNKGEK